MHFYLGSSSLFPRSFPHAATSMNPISCHPIPKSLNYGGNCRRHFNFWSQNLWFLRGIKKAGNIPLFDLSRCLTWNIFKKVICRVHFLHFGTGTEINFKDTDKSKPAVAQTIHATGWYKTKTAAGLYWNCSARSGFEGCGGRCSELPKLHHTQTYVFDAYQDTISIVQPHCKIRRPFTWGE